MKQILLSSIWSMLTAVALFFSACGDDSSSKKNDRTIVTEVNSKFELGACNDENEGDTVYTIEEEEEYLCSGGYWTLIPADSASKDSIKSSSSKKGQSSSSVSAMDLKEFADLCKASGGKEENGVCICGEEICDIGSVCNTMSKKCANAIPSGEAECDDDFKSTCTNSAKGIGIVKECVKGVLMNRSCATVSCNEEGTDCGECLDDVSTCTEDKKFAATVTRCEKGKKITETCDGRSCNSDNACGECTNYEHTCIDSESGIGTIYECSAGESKKVVSQCGNTSCRKDIIGCGECRNGEVKCLNDSNENAIIWKCIDGLWKRLTNRLDPLSPTYVCPEPCRLTTALSRRLSECYENAQREEFCKDCDPCTGSPYQKAGFFNPCYDEERCAALQAEEAETIPEYPPFRRHDPRMTIEVTGYNFSYTYLYVDSSDNYNPPEDKVGTFFFDLTYNHNHVSCNATGTNYGRCHNTLAMCLNTAADSAGFFIMCKNGALVDIDGNGDDIACFCANGTTCYTKTSCFKNSNPNAAVPCRRPESPESGYGENPLTP